MIEKCSIGNMSYNIQNITLIILILILIIVIIYYLRNSSTKHNELIEKYTNTDIKSDESYNTHNAIANSQTNSEFPTSGTEITLRDCQVQFNNKFDGYPNDTVRYVYEDGWQEIATLKEPGVNSTVINIPEKIISRSNETNQDAITNYSERSKCFRKMSDTDNKYRYQGNDLIQYRTGNNLTKGTHSQLNADGALENYMEMKFNLDPLKTSDYYNNLKTSICSLKYSNTLGGTSLGDKVLYRLTLNARYQITAINQITINSTNNHIFTVNSTTDLAALLTSSGRDISYVYNGNNFVYKDKLNNTGTQINGKNNIDVEIYTFNRELLCNRENGENVKYQTIKSYKIIDNNKIDVNTILTATSGDVEDIIENTNFPGTATDKSYTSKDSLLTAIETRIKSEKDTANASFNTAIATETDNVTTTTTERNVFLTSINTKATFFDKIFDADTVEIRRNFLVSESGLISGLELNKLGYKTADVSADETILTATQEPSFSKVVNNNEEDIYTIETYTDTSRPYTITFDKATICDILIVGGGGAGGDSMGGGGGAGGVVYTINQRLQAGTYTIGVGKGGIGKIIPQGSGQGTYDSRDQNGQDSFIQLNGIDVSMPMGGANQRLRGYGGGGGGVYHNPRTAPGFNGGSGGGCSETNDNGFVINTAGSATQGNTLWDGARYVAGGKAGRQNTTTTNDYNAGGGGGAGNNGASYKDGNAGVQINITGTSQFYAAGGGAGQYEVQNSLSEGIGGSGIGGTGRIRGSSSYLREATSGTNGTGSGGGGGAYTQDPDLPSGSGGSGIVIIRYKNVPEQTGNEKQITLKYDNDNLVAWYRFNGNYLDSSGNGHNLTNVGTAIQSAQIIEGQAVEFDSTDYLEFPTTINPYNIWNGKGITFSFWVRFTAHENWARLIDIQDKTYSTNGIFISVKSGSGPAIWINVGGTVFQYSDWNNSLISNLNTWNHIVFSINKLGQWDLYLNNVRINNNEVSSVPNITYNLRYINKSVYSWDGQWKGQMDDFRIYDRPFSASDVKKMFNKTYTLPSNIYRTTLPIQTTININGNAETLNAGTYEIIMDPSGSEIRNRDTKAFIGNGKYAYTDGNKLILKYAMSKTLSQLHELSTTFSGTQYKNSIADEKYSLGTKEINKITKYRIYIYRKQGVNHIIQLYAGDKLLTNGTDYTTSGSNQEAGAPTITLYNFYITINKTISGAIYLKSDNPIFYIDETSRTTFNNTTVAQFETNVNNLTDSASPKLPILNSMFGVTEATRDLATARNNLITYNIGSNAKLTIDFKSNPVSRTSLNNLAIAYNTISGYSPQGSGGITPILNANFSGILNSAPPDIDEYISYEFPSPPTDAQITPSNRANRFNIKSQATKYVYFKKKGGGQTQTSSVQTPNDTPFQNANSQSTGGNQASGLGDIKVFKANDTVSIPPGGWNCDILMIGGGGGANRGGGGAGACIVAIGQKLPAGRCVISVGNGGGEYTSGGDSSISVGGNTIYLAKGGGSSGDVNANGKDGGCGGGAGVLNGSTTNYDGGIAVATNIVNGIPSGPAATPTYAVFGNRGGHQRSTTGKSPSGYYAYPGGGGGIGSPGQDNIDSNPDAGNGGKGLNAATINGITYNFKQYFGVDGFNGNGYIGGGGGGDNGTAKNTGANGLTGSNKYSNDAVLPANTGSGGNGAFGAGSSGIVIIRLRT